MNSTATAVPNPATASVSSRAIQDERRERLFYLIASIAMITAVAIGFHMFYLHGLNDAGKPVTRQITPLVIVHGGVMTCWMAFLVLQCGLIVARNRRVHTKLGKAAFVLYLAIVPIGAITAVLQIHYAPSDSFPPFGPWRFLTLPLVEIVNFALFIGTGFLFRRTPALHRALMMMGTLSVAQAGIGRIGAIRNMFFQASHANFFFTFWGSTVLMLLLLWGLKLAMTYRWDRHFAAAATLLIASGVVSSYVSTTVWWLELAHWMTR